MRKFSFNDESYLTDAPEEELDNMFEECRNKEEFFGWIVSCGYELKRIGKGVTMMSTVIKMLDTHGDFHELATYSLKPKEALIAYYMQTENKNFNTQDYPKELKVIKTLPASGRLSYERHTGDIVFTSNKEDLI